ncbi:MAG: hypothetical protein EA425_18390 [Puniceicoccaceae bacterium]|nr:MAG: hypothetical protein EA425_18390 [Puniceicoccaceae bacterium]
MSGGDELAGLAEAFRRMGAEPGPAEVMARQLLKRADQLAAERSISREAALRWLLEAVAEGRRGEPPPPPPNRP